MVADRCSGITHRVVCGDDNGAFAEVGFERALEEITCVEKKHCPTVRGAGGPEIPEEAVKQRETASAAGRKDGAVQIVGAND